MLNHIVIMGRLVKDPELRRTQGDIAVCSVALAVEREKKDASGKRGVDYIDVILWRERAEFFTKYFHKGDMAAVEGRLQSRDWTDREGNNRRSWEVQAERVHFAGAKKDTANTYNEADATPGPQYTEAEDDGDLPF